MENRGIDQGRHVAVILSGAWRALPPSANLTPEVLTVTGPLLIDSGAAPLAWQGVRHSPLQRTPPARVLRDAYYAAAIATGRHEDLIRDALRRLRGASVEPILIKGWAAGRLYPDASLRPCGDIDLCVAPAQLADAERVLTEANGKCIAVELHEGVPDVTDCTWDHLLRRSRLLPLGDTAVRVLGPEDQLRQLCLHFWRHHAYRPLWLCDIAAAMEGAPADFDWELCLGGDAVLAGWARTFLALACRLLGAVPGHPAIAAATERLPRWLVDAVLWQWGNGMERRPLRHYCRHPSELPGVALHQWVNPLLATYRAGLRPDLALPWIVARALLGQPLKVGPRLVRIVRKRARRWTRTTEKPFNVHLQTASRHV